MKLAKRVEIVCDLLATHYPKSTCALHYESPFQLLVATVLSAQTTDKGVNNVTPALFAKFPTAEAMADATQEEIGELINSIGLWRNKSKFLLGLSQKLVTDFGGELPRTVAELKTLPGVARKTATATLGTAFGLQAGITVDTHMIRINRLLGFSSHTQADKMSKELESLIPVEHWVSYTHRIIDHGRLVCVARRPRCGVCPLAQHCPSHQSQEAGYKADNDLQEPASAANLSWL